MAGILLKSAGSTLLRIVPVPILMVLALPAVSQAGVGSSRQSNTSVVAGVTSATPPDLTGVYALVPSNATFPVKVKATPGTLDDIPLQPQAVAIAKTRDLKDDPAKNCQPIGPFRMMARDGNKIELLPSPDRITMLFQSIALGYRREIYLTRPHPEKLSPTWEGDSIGHWEGDTLVVDTIGFNDKTWLNGAGAPHSEALHLIERYRLVLGGKYLEVQVTAEDPKVFIRPYTYTRYYERLKTEIMEDVCQPGQ